MEHREIDSLSDLDAALRDRRTLRGLRLQDLDLRDRQDALLAHEDMEGLVVLGGRLPDQLAAHLRARGALIFPTDPGLPVNPYRAHLYRPTDLYAGLTDHGYAKTPDALAYAWSLDRDRRRDAYATLMTAIHDDSILDALDEVTDGRRTVGIMGGHAVRRGSAEYAAAARLGHHLAGEGLLVATGGGPGAMEATNLGAYVGDGAALEEALRELSRAPGFTDGIDDWALPALRLHDRLAPDARLPARSIGVPTWFYGHEPPNLFCRWLAKFFSNAIREDVLLQRCNAGVIVLPGAAGTVQEIFQTATRMYYAPDDGAVTPLVLVGRDQWSARVPVWDALRRLARGHPMEAAIHLVDRHEQALDLIDGSAPASAARAPDQPSSSSAPSVPPNS